MSDNKQGFLYNVVSDTGSGHQIQVAFNLPVGATKADIDVVLDAHFAAVARQAARLRLPSIEQQVIQQAALVEGVQKSVERLRESPSLNGKRSSANEAAFHQAQSQHDADVAKLGLLKRNLELTAKEAEVEVSDAIHRLAVG